MFTIRKFAALITAVAAFGLLFVVVCPITVTPVAVVSSHAAHLFGFGVATLATVALQSFVLALASARVAAISTEAQPPHPGHEHLIDLTCARLC